MIECMHRSGSPDLAHRCRSAAVIFCTFLVLVPSVYAATMLAAEPHDGRAGHHSGGMLGGAAVPAHAHWSSSAEQADELYSSHVCCGLAMHKPAREKGVEAPGLIAAPAPGGRTGAGPMVDPFDRRLSVEAPPGRPGSTATSAPLRC